MGIPVIAQITRQGGANFPIAVGEDIKGAFVTVADLTARDAIPTNILRTGALVRIGATTAYYQWNGSAWASYAFGGGGGDIKSDGTVTFAADQSMGGHKLTTLANGAAASQDAATVAQVEALVSPPEYNNVDSGTAKTIALSNGQAQKLRMTGNCTLNFTLDRVGWTQVRYYQDGTGGRTLTHPGSVEVVGGGTITIATGIDASTIVSYYYNGTTLYAVAAAGSAATGAGGGRGFRFTYSTTTADADPGAGTFRANNATLSSATTLYVDLAEYGGTDVTTWLDSLDDTTGAAKGVVRLASQSDPTKWIEYTLSAWTTAAGYRKLTVAYLAGPGGLTTTAGDTYLSFDTIGFTGTIATANIAAAAVTGPKLSAPAATGAQLLWDGTQWLHVGTTSAILADASVTIQFATASQYIWPSTVDAASARNLTFGNTGLAAGPMAGRAAVMTILFLRSSYTSAINVKNIATTTIFTVPAALGKPLVARFFYDDVAADWALAGWDYLSEPVAA